MTNSHLPEATWFNMWREQHDIKFEAYFQSKFNTPAIKVAVCRNSYDDQSRGSVDSWSDSKGWIRIVSFNIDALENVFSLSYAMLPIDKTNPKFNEKYDAALAAIWKDTEKMMTIALRIVQPHDTI